MENNTAPSRLRLLPVLVFLLMIFIGGGLTGMATAVAGSIFYIALVFPVGMGFAGGLLVSQAVKVTKIRSAGLVLLLSVLAAAIIYGSFHYGRYLVLQLQSAFLISSRLPEATPAEKLLLGKIIVSSAMKEETGYPGFFGYMLYRAKSGISIGRFYSQDRLELTSLFACLYWALEFGIILWIARGMAETQARKPLCEACGRWYGRERHLGGTIPDNEALLLDLLRRNELVELGRIMEKDAGLPSVELYLQRCEACGKSSATLTARRAFLGAKGSVQLSDISKATLRPGDSTLFLDQLTYELD